MTHDDWKQKLTLEQYRVLREKETEAPFTGKLLNNKKVGMYTCAGCGTELFSSDAKFDSGTGWPSFDEPANLENLELKTDTSYGATRTEVICKTCGGHLGHVFEDPPSPRASDGQVAQGSRTGKRFCINSCSLDFKKNP